METHDDEGVASPSDADTKLRMMLLAVFAPFGAIALMATPLALSALRHAIGL